jgi:hypothetical protein
MSLPCTLRQFFASPRTICSYVALGYTRNVQRKHIRDPGRGLIRIEFTLREAKS